MRPSTEPGRRSTRPSRAISAMTREIRLGDRLVRSARSVMLSCRPGDSDRCIKTEYSVELNPHERWRSSPRARGNVNTRRIKLRQTSSSSSFKGATSTRQACHAVRAHAYCCVRAGLAPRSRGSANVRPRSADLVGYDTNSSGVCARRRRCLGPFRMGGLGLRGSCQTRPRRYPRECPW
jgi:hypothetical protein